MEEIDIPYDSFDEPGIKEEEMSSFDCELCSMSFSNESGVKKHVKSVHLSNKVKCNLCNREMTQKSFRRHSKVHKMVLPANKSLDDAERAPAGEGGLEEQTSDEQITEPDSIDPCEMLCKVEMNEGSGEGDKNVNLSFKGVECKTCHQMYSNKLNLKKHVYNVHRMVRVKCHICDKEINKKSLDRHMKSVHSARVEFKKERKPVSEEEKVPCMLCDKKCLNMISLQNHIRNIHEAEQFKCTQCDFQGIRRTLEKHMKKEHNDEVHQCPRCHKILKSKGTLKEHMLVHTEDRRFICDICGMRFKRTSNYHGHLKSHQEKKFQCQLCGNFFLRKRYLAVHEQTIHNYYGEGVPPQEKGYQCEVCGVKLKWKNNLLAHMRIHTGEKPYKCKLCGEDFTCHGSLRLHMAKHGVFEDLENIKGRLTPLEAAGLSTVLEVASLQLYIIDVGICSNSPDSSNVIARQKVTEVIDETMQEIIQKGTFEILYEKAKEEAEAKRAAKLLMDSMLQNQSRKEDLKSKLKGQEFAKLRDMNEKQEIIASLKDKIHEEMIINDVKLRYIDRWEAARQSQSRMRCQNAELEWERKLEEITNNYNNEIRVHDEICTFLALEEKAETEASSCVLLQRTAEIGTPGMLIKKKSLEDLVELLNLAKKISVSRELGQVLLEELQKWKEIYEKEMKRRIEKIKMLEVRRKELQILHHNLLELYEEHEKEINAYLDVKEKLQQEEERNRFINEMATRIQAWWRGTMVRRGLGPFKKKKKLGKEKKK